MSITRRFYDSSGNTRDYYDSDGHDCRDHDACDAPRGSDPLIRHENGREWFQWQGSWYQVGTLPKDARREYIEEQLRRDRKEKYLL